MDLFKTLEKAVVESEASTKRPPQLEGDNVNDALVDVIITSLQAAIQTVGFMPDDCGKFIKKVLVNKDTLDVLLLITVAHCLESCYKEESWDKLVKLTSHANLGNKEEGDHPTWLNFPKDF